MSAKLLQELFRIEAMPDPEQAAAMYQTLFANIKSFSSPADIRVDLIGIAEHLLRGPCGVVSKRDVLNDFIATVKSFDNSDMWIAAGQYLTDCIGTIPPLASSLLEQSCALRELAAAGYERRESFFLAAQTLAEIPLDSSQRRVSDAEKVAIWVRIVRNYLEADESTAAETYLNKLKNIMHLTENPEQILHFKLSAARIQDSKRQFLVAAHSYHDISFTPAIAEEERLHTLSMAIKCAILAPAGPSRSRVLGRLYKDERSAGLEEYGILEKMFLDRLLAPAEVDKFAQGLAPHQLATTSDGSTVLAKAVVEHNLLGASRLYSNIGFDALGLLLGLSGDKAEDTTAKMIEQGRLMGSIDQIDRIIYFESGEPTGEKGSGRADVPAGKEMRRWDSNVQGVAEEVEQLADALQSEFPGFVATRIAV